MRSAVLANTFDPKAEHPEAITSTTKFGEFLDEYVRDHVQANQLRSNSIDSYVAVFRKKFGNEPLGRLAANPSMWERWLNECRRRGSIDESEQSKNENSDSRWADATYVRYVQFGRALFNWARRRKMVSENPFDVLELPTVVNTRETRISPAQEEKLLAACGRLDEPPKSKLMKVTPELVVEIRNRAESGELQKDIAASTGLSRPLVCQIIKGQVWNPNRRRRCLGLEMKRRIIAAMDLGLRAGEMLQVQVKHVDYDNWRLNLPAAITKAKKDQQLPVESERLKEVLNERRTVGSEGFVFGKEDGSYVGSFDKTWHRLFKLAGLPDGRKQGYTWHDFRHEYCSYLADEGAGIHELKELARHSDIRTTARYLKPRDERLRQLAGAFGKRHA
jgi:integrase